MLRTAALPAIIRAPFRRACCRHPGRCLDSRWDMESNLYHLSLAQSDYATVAVLVILATGIALAILILTHLIGPKRVGKIKDSTYESGMEPFSDTRRRFSVRFYLIAVLFLIFDVEIVFLYPWAVLYPRLQAAEKTPYFEWAQAMRVAGYTPGVMLAAIAIFFGLLLVGFIYEWRRGIFKWN